jgi:membrane associated rhomboid family serine protease
MSRAAQPLATLLQIRRWHQTTSGACGLSSLRDALDGERASNPVGLGSTPPTSERAAAGHTSPPAPPGVVAWRGSSPPPAQPALLSALWPSSPAAARLFSRAAWQQRRSRVAFPTLPALPAAAAPSGAGHSAPQPQDGGAAHQPAGPGGGALAKQMLPGAALSAASLAAAEPGLALLSFLSPWGRGRGRCVPFCVRAPGRPGARPTAPHVAAAATRRLPQHAAGPLVRGRLRRQRHKHRALPCTPGPTGGQRSCWGPVAPAAAGLRAAMRRLATDSPACLPAAPCPANSFGLMERWTGDPSRAVTNAIIAAGVAVYALDHLLLPGLNNHLLLYNWAVAHGQWCAPVRAAACRAAPRATGPGRCVRPSAAPEVGGGPEGGPVPAGPRRPPPPRTPAAHPRRPPLPSRPPRRWRLLTCAFTHTGLLHLLVNSVSIHFVCPSVEGASGRARFLALYLGSALAGSLASFNLHSIYHASAGSSGEGRADGCTQGRADWCTPGRRRAGAC